MAIAALSLLAVVELAAILWHGGGVAKGDLLVFPSAQGAVGEDGASVGAPFFFGIWTAMARGSRPIRLVKVEILGVPKGVAVDGIWAERWTETRGHIGSTGGDEARQRLTPLFHPFS